MRRDLAPQEREWIRRHPGGVEPAGRNSSPCEGNHDRAFSRDFSQLPVETLARVAARQPDRGSRRPACPGLDGIGRVAGARTLSSLGPDRRHRGRDTAIAGFPGHSRAVRCCRPSPPSRKGFDVASGLPAEPCAHTFGDEEIDAYAATATRVVRLGGLFTPPRSTSTTRTSALRSSFEERDEGLLTSSMFGALPNLQAAFARRQHFARIQAARGVEHRLEASSPARACHR